MRFIKMGGDIKQEREKRRAVEARIPNSNFFSPSCFTPLLLNPLCAFIRFHSLLVLLAISIHLVTIHASTVLVSPFSPHLLIFSSSFFPHPL